MGSPFMASVQKPLQRQVSLVLGPRQRVAGVKALLGKPDQEEEDRLGYQGLGFWGLGCRVLEVWGFRV